MGCVEAFCCSVRCPQRKRFWGARASRVLEMVSSPSRTLSLRRLFDESASATTRLTSQARLDITRRVEREEASDAISQTPFHRGSGGNGRVVLHSDLRDARLRCPLLDSGPLCSAPSTMVCTSSAVTWAAASSRIATYLSGAWRCRSSAAHASLPARSRCSTSASPSSLPAAA